jgi:hypothetical protein
MNGSLTSVGDKGLFDSHDDHYICINVRLAYYTYIDFSNNQML